MRARRQRSLLKVHWLALAIWGVIAVARADVLIGTNGERFTGKVVEEKADAVVFDSELAGRLTIPRARIRELQRTAPAEFSGASQLTNRSLSITNQSPMLDSQLATNSWRPPAIGQDNFDWLQLKSGEWLKGHLKYIQERKVEFDSDELEDLSLKLKDVRQLYPAEPLFTKFYDRQQIYGAVVISNDVVQVSGPEQLSLPRDQLTGITPGGDREREFWSGKASISLSYQAGNTKQATESTSAELSRRTPSTVFQLTYLGNFGEVNGTQNANNHRINGHYDIRVNRDWFVRPLQLEYYRDQLANIAHKGTVGIGLGYYIFDRDGLEWQVAGGPGYQYTRYETVEPGQDDTASAAAAVLQTSFKADITQRLKFIQTFSATLTSRESGLYSHHSVTTLEFEIKRHLDLNVSLVWDYLQNPQTESNGTVPQHGDFRLNVGLGVKF